MSEVDKSKTNGRSALFRYALELKTETDKSRRLLTAEQEVGMWSKQATVAFHYMSFGVI